MRSSKILSVLLALMIGISGCAGQSGAGNSGNEPGDGTETVADQTTVDQTANDQTADDQTAEDQAAEDQNAADQEEPGEYSKALAKRSQSSEESDPTLTAVAEEEGQNDGGQNDGGAANGAQKKCTVMIYMVGSNLESRLGNATKDLEEIDGAELSFEDFNVIAYTGGSARWVGDVPCDRNCVLDLSREGDERIVAQTQGNANMGLPETLSAFLNYCGENYPAEHNMLILWDHGGGPLWGYGVDELYDSDSLLLGEMRTAMEQSVFHGGEDGKKLDLVGFDACLMGSLECMTIWRDYADYYVGSEELEPGDGWNYEFLKVLEDPQSWENSEGGAAGEDGVNGAAGEDGGSFGRVVGKSVLASYEKYYDGRRSENYNPDLTLACVDLGKIGELNAALDALAEKMADGVEGGEYAALMKDRSDIKSFGMTKDSGGEVSFYYDLVDVGDFAGHMEAFYPEEAGAAGEALEAAVAEKYANVEDASGVTLYYPYKNKGQFEQLNTYYESFLQAEGYSKFLQLAGDQFLRSKSRDWNLGTPVDNGDEYTLQLTQEQLENMTEASYTILLKNYSFGGYIPYMENCKIEPDKDGVLHVSKNMHLAVMTNGDEMKLIRAEEVSSDRKRTVYRTKGFQLRSDALYVERISDLEVAFAAIRFRRDNKTGETEIQNIEMEEEGSVIGGGKNTVDLMDWESVSVLGENDFLVPARDGLGRCRPYSEWIRLETSVWRDFSVDSEISVEIADVSELLEPGAAVLQIEIRDTNGEKYATEPVSIMNDAVKTTTVAVGDGELEFELMADHAEVSGYDGREEHITVPAQVEGLPVTVIQSGAFSWYSVFDAMGYDPVREIELPDTVTTIEASAFAHCFDLEKVRFPSGLTEIGNEAFLLCTALTEAEVPDGVESIGKCAFAGCSALTQFRIPKGLKNMGEGAFMHCKALAGFTGGTENAAQAGGAERAGNLPVLDADGAVYTADGAMLLAYPMAAGKSFSVKKGTKEIGYGAFDGSEVLEEVILPEGLERIGNYAFYGCRMLKAPVLPEGLRKVGVHCFGMGEWAYETEEIPDQQEVVYIPASLEIIGVHAFDKFLNVRYEVSGDNRHYLAVDGALMNKAGDAVRQIATDDSLTAVFPEGTVEFTEESLNVYDSLNVLGNFVVKQIYLPASMTKFPEEIEGYRNKDEKAVYHCPAGSEAEKFALRMGLQVTNEMERREDKLEVPTSKGTLYFDIYSDHAVLTGYSGEDEVVEIPSEAGAKAVTAAGNGVEPLFSTEYSIADTGRKCPNLVKIVIPEGVTSINANALDQVNFGTEVVLPSTVRRLGKRAIDYGAVINGMPEDLEILEEECIGLFGDGVFRVTPKMSYIDGMFSLYVTAFEQEGENESFSVRDGVLYNADGTVLLRYPSAGEAEEFRVPDGTVYVGDQAFYNCPYLQKVELPDSLRKIGGSAFSGSNLTEVVFEDGTELESIGNSAFSNCDLLTEISLPPVEEIGANAFSYCDTLETVHFSEGTRSIGESAFQDTALAAPQFPESLVKIGSRAFGRYDREIMPGSAEVIRIPAKVKEIGEFAFQSIGNTSFEVDPGNTAFMAVDGLLLDKDGNMLYCCPAGKKGKVVVPDGVTVIEYGAFDYAIGVTDVFIPDSVIHLSGNFDPVTEYDDNGEKKVTYPITIHCSKESAAETYARGRDIPYKIE